MGSFLNILKLIELSFKTRQKYDLLVKNSLALTLLWFIILIAPMIPYSQSIPGLSVYADFATKGFIISFRTFLVVLLPLIFGFLYMGSDEFEEKYSYRPLKFNDFIEGLQLLSKQHDLKSPELFFIIFAAFGKGMILILNWIIIYILIVLGMVVEIWDHFITKNIKDEFFEIVHFEDEEEIISQLLGLISDDPNVYKTTEYQSVPFLQKPLLLFGKIFLGDLVWVKSKDIDILLMRSGIGAIGSMAKLRRFYKELIGVLFSKGIMCKFPTAIEIEAHVKDIEVDYEPLYLEENVPIEDIKWIRIKELMGKIDRS